MKELKTVNQNIQTEIIEKKSKFIANLFQVETIREAEDKLKKIRNYHEDARHYCYAYRIMEEEQIIQRYSDDGEPSGTAGAPILTILETQKLVNVIVIVTRYFGGILLGTGGLVKAYSEATKKAIKQVEIIGVELGYNMEVTISYADLEKFKYFCKQNNINIQKEEYLDNVNLWIELSEKMKNKMLEKYQNFNFEILKSRILDKKYILGNADI